MKYSPFTAINKSKLNSILYTDGGQFMFANGEEYIGFYYSIDDNYFAGAEYDDNSQKLFAYNDNINFNTYCRLKNRIYITKNNLIPTEYIPVINANDIQTGYINRYFIRQRNDINASVIEIDEDQYNSWLKPTSGININFYVAVKINWQIVGYSNSTYYNGHIVDSLEEYNKKQVQNQKVLDLSNIIQSYDQYANLII